MQVEKKDDNSSKILVMTSSHIPSSRESENKLKEMD